MRAPDTAQILCRSLTPKRHRQLRVKDLPTIPTRRLERDSNPRPFGRKATNLPMSHHALKHLITMMYTESNLGGLNTVACRWGCGRCDVSGHPPWRGIQGASFRKKC